MCPSLMHPSMTGAASINIVLVVLVALPRMALRMLFQALYALSAAFFHDVPQIACDRRRDGFSNDVTNDSLHTVLCASASVI